MKILAVLVQLCQMGQTLRVRRDLIGQNRLLNNLERHRTGKWPRHWPMAVTTDVDPIVQIGQWISLNGSRKDEEQWKSMMQKHKTQRCKQHGCKKRNRRRYQKYVRHF